MIIKILILLIAIIGAYVNGIFGFFVWGICAYIAAIVIGKIITQFFGGLIPKKLKYETATDFIAQNQELVKEAFPGKSLIEMTHNVAELLESMLKASTAFYSNPDQAWSQQYFPKVALRVAEEQQTEEKREVARKFVWFLNTHKLWWGKN